jgi:dienelactone hydrolase
MSPRAPVVLLTLSLAWPPMLAAQSSGFVERDTAVVTGKIRLPATITFPSGATHAPGVVLVHGSGPNDRDETVGANKPFRDLAHGLAERGIVVLRYDKRSKVAPLSFMGRPFTVDEEVVDDALSAAALLRGLPEVDPARVVVLGHSLGGMLAPRIGERDTALAGLVILAGATRPLTDMLEEQIAYMRGLPGADTAAIDKALESLAPTIVAIRALTPADSGSRTLLIGAPAAYWLDLAAYRPVYIAAKLRIPILILQGGRDYQVTMVDFETWRDGLAGNTSVEFREYPSLNHLFIAGSGAPNPAEYGVGGTVDPQVIADIAGWIQGLPSR